MSFFQRLPAEARKALALEKGERVLTFAAADEGHVVATDLALHLPGPLRVPYEEIDRAVWDEHGLLTVLTTDGRRHHARVAQPRSVPEALRERVNATIVVSKRVELPGRGGVRLVARRKPGGEVLGWTFIYDEGLDPEDPGLRALAEQALEGVRRSMGV